MKLADQIHTIMEENDNLTDEQLGQAVDSFLQIHTEEIQEDGLDTYPLWPSLRNRTPYRVLEVLFDAFPLTKEDVLLDYGSGLGRLAFYSAARFGCPCIGVEMAEKWYTIAERQSGFLLYRRMPISILSLILPTITEVDDRVTYIYCFNPFSPDVFRTVLTGSNVPLSATHVR